jgi:hypothetical protein
VKPTHLFAVVLWLSCVNAAFAQVTAIKAGRLVDPDAGTVLTDQIILIHENKIEAVGKALPIPAGAKVIDLSNMTVTATVSLSTFSGKRLPRSPSNR